MEIETCSRIQRNNMEERFDKRQIFEAKGDSSADDNGSVINLFRKLWVSNIGNGF